MYEVWQQNSGGRPFLFRLWDQAGRSWSGWRGAPVVSTEEPKVKAERGGIGGVAKWAIVSAVVGALSGIAAVPLGVIGINQQYDWARNAHWANQGVGMPPGATIAAAVLTTVSIIFISLAIALGIYALRSARKE